MAADSLTKPAAGSLPIPRARETAEFLSGCSMEVVPRGANPVGAIARHLPPGMPIYVACVPGEDYERVITVAVALRRAGFEPVPHLPVRSVPSRSVLDRCLGRLAGAAGVDRVLLLGGDVADHKVGPFASSLQMLRTGLLPQHGFRAVGFATYPEPHPAIDAAVLDSELRLKLAVARDAGLEPWLVSQFSYDADTVLRHARRLRADGVDVPLRIGFAGPASWAAMSKFSVICGFGNSVRALAQNTSRFNRLLAGFEPTEMLATLAECAAAEPALGLAGPHFFSFGGPERTARFIASLTAS